ncbi:MULTISPECIES: hypothetical protein [Halobacterium]|uniref:hypothetical protein n=1 Tax=Halobacterium TaxID=2239 RepID=UPI00073E8476|nr:MULTISPECIES: hypothetical protein [Halobacterium]MCG1002563.1 hypothetical protein [Halobacterium noricense]
MGTDTTGGLSLTEGEYDHEALVAERVDGVEAVSETLLEDHRDEVGALTADFHDDGAPGDALADADDADVLRAYVTDYCAEHVFPRLNDAGERADLTWQEFRRGVRALTELLYLRAFQRYRAARNEFAKVQRQRREGKDALADVESALEFDGEDGLSTEESLPDAVSRAEAAVADAEEHAEEAAAAVADTHFFYAQASAYRDEYDFDAAELDGVSLADDTDWYFQDLRHERDRLATRVDWLRRDFEKLAERA